MKKFSKILVIFFLIIPILINAEEVNTTYQGEYSIDYLLRNYNVVTFEKNNNPTYDFIEVMGLPKSNVNINIGGPVLINGDYYNDDFEDEGIEYSINNPNNVISHISGNTKSYVTTPSTTATNKDFIDYKKLYNNILAESQALVDKTQYHINSKHIVISKPGIYQINSTMIDADWGYSNSAHQIWLKIKNNIQYDCIVLMGKEIYIDNYDPDEIYIINNMKQFELNNYLIYIKGKDDDNFHHIDEYAEYEEYSGNIIFNYPNARFILDVEHSGKIIAPKADVVIAKGSINDFIHDSIYSNSVNGLNEEYYDFEGYTNIGYYPYTVDKKLEISTYDIKENEDFEDDIYSGTYSINEMLGNYNVVTLGQKEYEDNTMFYDDDLPLGSAVLFHIAGNFLSNGLLYSERLDLESNIINESAVNGELMFYREEWGNVIKDYYFKRWGDGDDKSGTNSIVFLNESPEIYNYSGDNRSSVLRSETPYINYKRLYDNIVEEQKKIKQGMPVTVVDGVAHIKIGENYYIDDINQIKEIVFDDFEDNNKKMTVITVLNKDYISFPKISQSNVGNYVPTKDYFGKKEPMFEYEYTNFPDDIYAGNIIWNVPDSKYISFETQTPIIGHLVAPNADVEIKETHFAGGFIVNSLYAENNSEAHFFPLQPVDIPENYDCFVANTNYFNGKWYTDEAVVDVNPTAKDVLEPPKEQEKPEEEITNPKTGETILNILLVITLAFSTTLVLILNKKQKMI